MEQIREEPEGGRRQIHALIIFMAGLAMLKHLVVVHLPIYIIPYYLCDDRLMVDMANALLNFQWLGKYDWLTLSKGAGFPLFLAVINFLGISYITASASLYAIAGATFVFAIRPIFRKSWALYVIYALLLLNPVSYALHTFQRVYRSGINLSQVLLIVGCIFAIYLRREKHVRHLIWWAVTGGLSLAWFWNTREDALWMMPFVVVALLVTLMVIYRSYGRVGGECAVKLALAGLPMVIWASSILAISSINYCYYGEYLTTEFPSGTFARAVKSLYAIAPADDSARSNDRLAVTRSTVKRLYEVSPTLQDLKPYLEESMDSWGQYDSHPLDGEVENGWFLWSLRGAVAKAGYYDRPENPRRIYTQIDQDIERAFASGLLQRRPVMPSTLMPPWRDGFSLKILKTMKRAFVFAVTFADVRTGIPEKPENELEGTRLFELTTHNLGYSSQIDNDASLSYAAVCSGICNSVGDLYRKCGAVFAALGLTGYVAVSASMILLKKANLGDAWLLLTGIGGSISALLAGVSYSDVALCPSITYMYLSGAYPLMIAYCSVSICIMVQGASGAHGRKADEPTMLETEVVSCSEEPPSSSSPS
jgi:hypothetical protein